MKMIKVCRKGKEHKTVIDYNDRTNKAQGGNNELHVNVANKNDDDTNYNIIITL